MCAFFFYKGLLFCGIILPQIAQKGIQIIQNK